MLNVPISDSEVSKTILSLPNGKVPRPDGLPNEYYNIFSLTLTPYLNTVFSKATQTSSFLPEMLKAQVITLLKPSKDPTSPAKFRPISLLNTDVKVYAKCLMHVLPSLT